MTFYYYLPPAKFSFVMFRLRLDFLLAGFLWIAENPAAICSPPASAGSHTPALPQCFWCGIFSRPSFRPGLNSCCQLRLSAVIPGDPIFDLRLAQSKLIRYLLPGCTLLPRSQNFFLQFLYMRVFPFTHTNTPCIGLFSYTGGVLSIVRFYWSGSVSSSVQL